MLELGYGLSSEEHMPNDVIRYIRLAEKAGFAFACLADHYHPWMERQDQSPFIWSIIGGIAQVTQRVRLVISVTYPMARMHPASIAQAVATVAAMMPGRCCLGLETGEHLRARIWGRHWRVSGMQWEMLQEAVQVIRLLWKGGAQSHWGRHYTIENVRIHTPPRELPPILIAAVEGQGAQVAGRVGDGLIGTAPETQLIEAFELAGGLGKPRYGKVSVCWARNEREARRIAYNRWRTAGLNASMLDATLPAPVIRAMTHVSETDVAQALLCSADPARHIAALREFAAAGYDHVYVHHVGPDQEGFLRFYRREVLPRFTS
jgi:coenzyme F420-dependent glucose-6-phosphate dehydrogenase